VVRIKTVFTSASRVVTIRKGVYRIMGRITVNLSEDEENMKKMIKDLQKSNVDGNPYLKRSESEVAKMILQPALLKEHQKYLKSSKQTVAS
jgi:hypothetical protein